MDGLRDEEIGSRTLVRWIVIGDFKEKASKESVIFTGSPDAFFDENEEGLAWGQA